MKNSYSLLCALLLVSCMVVPSVVVARGGRGRGGGSFGGIFGGWRSKYGSKSASSSGGRRVVSGSLGQSAVTVPKLPPPPPPAMKPMSMPKPQGASYPRQQLPPGYGYPAGAAAPTFYANAQTLPTGAMYYSQPPTGFGTREFLTGMLAGRLMDSVLFGNRHHVSHVYHQNQQGAPAAAGTGREIIVINNGATEAEAVDPAPSESLMPEQTATSPENPLAKEEEEQEQEESETESEAESSEETADASALPVPPVGGIICFPIMLNETDPQNSEVSREVERVVCFPAPSIDPQQASIDCQNNPECLLDLGITATNTEPPIVAGDIGGTADPAEDFTEVTATSPIDPEDIERN